MKFKIIAEDGNARVTKFKTQHGTVETPFYMPCATKMAVKHLTSSDLRKIGIQAIIVNALVVEFATGSKEVQKRGGIHKLMNFNKTIFTDSGGFQMILKSFYQQTTKKGVIFQNPYTKQNIRATPEWITEIQENIGSDVAMMLDDHNAHTHSKEKLAEAVGQTYEWGKRCLAAKTNNKQLMFGIVQGGIYPDLRRKSAQMMESVQFDGMALGGLATGEPISIMKNIVKTTVKHIDKNKPRYLMGLGSPVEMINTITMGIDCFDSAYPTQNARHKTLFTMSGKIDISKGKHKEDDKPIEENCNCYTCKNYSKAYVHHLAKTDEPIFYRLATYHNIFFMQKLMDETKTAIKEQRFKAFEKELEKNWKKR